MWKKVLTSNSQQTPPSLPRGASYVVSVVSISEKTQLCYNKTQCTKPVCDLSLMSRWCTTQTIFYGAQHLRSIWPSNQLGVTVVACGYRTDWSSRITAGMLGAIEREIVVEDRQLIKWSTIDMDLLDFCTKRLLSPAVILQTPFSTPLV